MRINRLRTGIVVANKVDGKYYKVTNVSVQDSNQVGTAYELCGNPEDPFGCNEELGEDCVFITEKNALAFRLVSDTEPYPVPEGYSVSNGKIVKNGMLICEQGTIVVDSILAAQPDHLILTCNKAENGHVDVMSYQLSRDRFVKLCADIAAPKCVGNFMDKVLLAYSEVLEKEVETDDGKTTVREFQEASLYLIKDGQVLDRKNFAEPVCVHDIEVVEYPSKDTVLPKGYEVFVPSDESVDGDDIVEKRDVRKWYVVRSDQTFRMNGEVHMSWSYAEKDWVISNGKELLVLNKNFHVTSPEIAKLQGYDHLIDITKGEYCYTLTFSNDNYEFKTLVSKSTKDRGYIITVE